MYDLTGNYSCYQPYYSSGYSPIEKEGPVDKFFGGQSLVKYYIEEAAPNAKTMSQTKYDAITVSYTHLDVYKRQDTYP